MNKRRKIGLAIFIVFVLILIAVALLLYFYYPRTPTVLIGNDTPFTLLSVSSSSIKMKLWVIILQWITSNNQRSICPSTIQITWISPQSTHIHRIFLTHPEIQCFKCFIWVQPLAVLISHSWNFQREKTR